MVKVIEYLHLERQELVQITVNIIPADYLVTKGARASAGMTDLVKLEYSIANIWRVNS